MIAGCQSHSAPPSSSTLAPPPAPALPAISDRVFNVTDYGAVGDGKTMNTDAINKAIVAANAAGGGKVVIPAGNWLTGPIQLLSNVELNTQQGTNVTFSRNIDDYPLIVSNFEGLKAVRATPPLSAYGQHNIAVTGPGVFDGGGEVWRMVKKKFYPADKWDSLVASGGVTTIDIGDWLKTQYGKKKGKDKNSATTAAPADDDDSDPNKKPEIGETWYPSIQSLQGASRVKALQASKEYDNVDRYLPWRIFLRPPLVEIFDCDTVLLDGPTFRNSPGWNVHPIYTNNLTIRNVTIFNFAWAVNGDGIDIDSCKDVLMTDCNLNAGDDGLCIKSGRDEEGRKVGKPTENVVITRCTVGTGHGGFVIGSEMSGGVRHVWCSDCTFNGTDVGLRFKTTRGRGGVVEDIHVDNITMTKIKREAILFDMYYQVANAKREVKPVDITTPRFRDIHVNNVTCDGAKQAIKLVGLPELPLEDVTIQDVKIVNSDTGITVDDCNDITLRRVTVRAKKGEPIKQGPNVTNLTLDQVQATTRPTEAAQAAAGE
jgi:DNA sulfur modification protein DndE